MHGLVCSGTVRKAIVGERASITSSIFHRTSAFLLMDGIDGQRILSFIKRTSRTVIRFLIFC